MGHSLDSIALSRVIGGFYDTNDTANWFTIGPIYIFYSEYFEHTDATDDFDDSNDYDGSDNSNRIMRNKV